MDDTDHLPRKEKEKCSEVRIGNSLNESESQHVANRRATVQQCLQEHNIFCSVDEVPNIALAATGGGERAMIGLLGSLSQLSEERLLDCIMYLGGDSGSTWCMASVYKEPDWSNQMETVKQNIIKRLNQGKITCSEQYKMLAKMCEKDNFNVTDIWAIFIVSDIVKEIDDHVLTEQRGQNTNNPYPIYTVIDKKCKHNTLNRDTWFEITPHECGYSQTGAFVDSKSFGSQFEKGAKTKEQPEIDMMYLQGLCGSALADVEEIRNRIQMKSTFTTLQGPHMEEGYQVLCNLLEMNISFHKGNDPSIYVTNMNELLEGKHDKDGQKVKIEDSITEETVKKHTLSVCHSFFDWFPELKDFWKVIVKCIEKVSQWDWGTKYNFLYKMKVDDVHPSVLKSEKRHYEDTGLLINSPYLSILRKERNVDLIISLDFNSGVQFETVDQAAQMCKDLQIPFPTVEHPENIEEPEDFYVFKDNPNAPVVIHMPLFNAMNCKGEVKMWENKYTTFQLAYSEEMISNHLEKAGLNIKNTKEKLLKEIEEVIQEKKN
ncbi:cytosolic phospholipase A2 gamma-like [Electrophorus electricus]|uniref:cytosolic phospholipase A2 gamma-like n=1 Tax=Electrophorus electricus TaxID=8005 RepID=UPI0015CF8AC4|nr:cytosolic phospholipase A2 gamma-like [Electrophorus electricus]